MLLLQPQSSSLWQRPWDGKRCSIYSMTLPTRKRTAVCHGGDMSGRRTVDDDILAHDNNNDIAVPKRHRPTWNTAKVPISPKIATGPILIYRSGPKSRDHPHHLCIQKRNPMRIVVNRPWPSRHRHRTKTFCGRIPSSGSMAHCIIITTRIDEKYPLDLCNTPNHHHPLMILHT